jgi:hypothetical protein
VALYLLLRYRKGANRRLAGGYSMRLVRMVSVLLVAAGCGTPSKSNDAPEDPARPEPAKPAIDAAVSPEEFADVKVDKEVTIARNDLFPKSLNAARANHWLSLQDKKGTWARFKQAIALGQEVSAELTTPAMHKEFIALGKTEPSLEDLRKLLVKWEGEGVFDTWIVGFLYQAGERSTEQGKASLYGLLESHNRVAETLVIALGHSKVIRPRAWMSKAAPPADYNRKPTLADPEAFIKEAKRRYPTQDSGTWRTQARVAVALESGNVLLHRRNEAVALMPQSFYLRRLDVLETKNECTLRLPYLGTIVLPTGTEFTSTSLASHLSPEGRALASFYVTQALHGDADATRKVGRLLPVLKEELRKAVNDKPEAKGASAVRSMLFDADW